MRYMPWIAIVNGQSLGPNGYALDYTAMLSPMVLIHSLKCRHSLVSVVAISSILLKGMIALAPGLFRLATVEVSTQASIRLLDTFADRISSIGDNADTSPYYIRRAVQDFNMSYPFGATETVAYQTFQLADAGLGSRGTLGAPLRVVVDGFTVDVECREMEDHNVSMKLDREDGLLYYKVDASLTFKGCNHPINLTQFQVGWYPPSASNGGADQTGSYWVVESNFTSNMGCSSLPQSQPQFLYFAGFFKPSAQNASIAELANVGSVMCAPNPKVSKVEVTDDGINTTVRFLPNQEPKLFKSDFTELLHDTLPTLLGKWYFSLEGEVMGPVDADLLFVGISADNNNVSLYRNDVLHGSVTNLFRLLGSLTGHFSLKEASSSEVTGARLVRANRLVVDQRAALSFAAVASVAAGLMLWSFFRIAPKEGILPRDPATVLGSILFLKDNSIFLRTPTNSKLKPKEQEAADWATTTYSPLLWRMWFRAAFILILLGIIGGLLFLLWKSQTLDGLATIENEQYLHLLWTSLPTLVMVVVSLCIVSINGAHRKLFLLSALSTRSVNSQELDLSLIDMYGPRVWYYSVRMKAYIVTLSEALAVLSSFLTIIVSTVYVVNVAPGTNVVQLQQKTWFGSRDFSQLNNTRRTRETLSSLLLRLGGSNFTYPQNTYGDLLFPVLESLGHGLPLSANISTKVKMPAVKLDAKCTQLSVSDYSISINNFTEDGETFYSASVKQPAPCPDGGTTTTSLSNDFALARNAGADDVSYVAGNLDSPQNPYDIDTLCNLTHSDAELDDFEYMPWRTKTYFWGRLLKSQPNFDFHTAWRCNYSWTALDADVVLFLAERLIEHDSPPVLDEASKRPLVPAFAVPHVDYTSTRHSQGTAFPEVNLLNRSEVGSFASAFSVLLEPFGPFPVSAFGEAGSVDAILKSLTYDYAFLSAQLANLENRLSVDEMSFRAPFKIAEVDVPPVPAEVVDGGRRRLIQNAGPTWALVGILSLVAAIHSWALISTALRRAGMEGKLLLDMDLNGVAPDGVGSIAVMARLLAGSNVLERLPKGQQAQLLPVEQVHGLFARRGFRMGWFRNEGDQKVVYTVGVVENDGVTTYLGSKGDISGKQSLARRYPGEAVEDTDRVPLRVDEFPLYPGR